MESIGSKFMKGRILVAKYLVDTVALFHMRYVVETNHPDYAVDEVMVKEKEEFSQRYIGNNVLSVREITTDEYLKIFDEDNDYLKHWSDEQKLDFIK